jgi:hypothetical protein
VGLGRGILYAISHTLKDQAFNVLLSLGAQQKVQSVLHNAIRPTPKNSPWLINRSISPTAVAEDGCVMSGPVPTNAYAKFALRKGLPQDKARTLAVENDPHRIDDFDGVIDTGYGKGTKSLLSNEIAIVKVGRRTFPAKINYHVHHAARAGKHFDLAIEGLKPGTPKFELHIPRGEFKGRYAFNTTPQGIIVVPMRDRGLVLPKPNYSLKDTEWLKQLDPKEWVFEQKLDGSLANAHIHDDRVAFRSHRDTGQTYYDRLPQLEHLRSTSRFAFMRLAIPGAGHNGTVIVGELYHPDGAARVGGILNAHPQKAREIQALRGPVRFYGWNIVKLHGRDVSRKPYEERRALLEQAIREIRLVNKNWDIVPKDSKGDPYGFYQEVVSRPLPYGEGIVAKKVGEADGEGTWFKVKQTDFADFEIVEVLEGRGKYAGSAGKLVVRLPRTSERRLESTGRLAGRLGSDRGRVPGDPTGPRLVGREQLGEVGSFGCTDEKRQWIWDHRDELPGAVVKVRVQEITKRGVPRAGVFMDFHEGKGSTEAGLAMYAESLAGGDPELAERTKYALKSAAGWQRS